jgi:hypothetical protein
LNTATSFAATVSGFPVPGAISLVAQARTNVGMRGLLARTPKPVKR